MREDIRRQNRRMAFVLIAISVLGVWQWDFVLRSIEANIFLNASILALFGFGCFLIYRAVSGLDNELLAFEALQEEYRSQGQFHLRQCDTPAKTFVFPALLGHAYSLISDQIAKTGKLQITSATMQNLVDGVELRIDDQKSVIQYVSGLLVFLGLIGTFVGLMQTVGSVGGIIGSLNLSAGGDVQKTMQDLIVSLRGPLVGMATGFSSSLFGLITSLALGLMLRFATSGMNVLKVTFEAWLAGTAQLEKTADGTLEIDTEGFGERAGAKLAEAIGSSIGANSLQVAEEQRETALKLDALVEAVERLAGRMDASITLLSKRVASAQVTNDRAALGEDVLDQLRAINGQLQDRGSAEDPVISSLEASLKVLADQSLASMTEVKRLIDAKTFGAETVSFRATDGQKHEALPGERDPSFTAAETSMGARNWLFERRAQSAVDRTLRRLVELETRSASHLQETASNLAQLRTIAAELVHRTVLADGANEARHRALLSRIDGVSGVDQDKSTELTLIEEIKALRSSQQHADRHLASQLERGQTVMVDALKLELRALGALLTKPKASDTGSSMVRPGG
ncbi:MAG: hypothetical protein ACFB6S_00455 [Geminicoccaceae bacterium]